MIKEVQSYKFSVAPMIDWTDRHCRYFHRLLSRHARLYTEMIVADGILRGDRDYLLGFDAAEHPVALQLGGSNPETLAAAAKIGEDFGYDEINLNVGCPSDRVQSGTFGACLMKTPDIVADCFGAMSAAVKIPVTIKCRIGVDDQDPNEALFNFIEKTSSAGCDVFIIHARKAWLKGLSPKENRTIPPLDYDLIYRLKEQYATKTIVLNGGLTGIEQSGSALAHVDGVMLGREAYDNPFMLAAVDHELFGDDAQTLTRAQIIEQMTRYLDRQMKARPNMRPHAVTRHMIGLFHGQSGARQWRRYLTENATKTNAGPEVLMDALNAMQKSIG